MTKKILLVDDANDLRALLIEVLNSDERFEVVADAASGEKALALAEERAPDLCIIDVNLDRNGLTGPETAVALRTALPDASIVLYSGDDRFRSEADAIGVAFVEKMMNPAKFCEAIASAIGA